MSSAEKIFRIAGVLCFFISWAGGKTCPNLGVIWNDDGDYAITSEDPRQAAEMVRYLIDSCVGTGIKTITYSIGAGSEILLYPTRIGNNWGWRTTRYDTDPRWKARITCGRALAAANYDALRVAADQARKHGFYFFPSCRMNDSHFIFDPEQYPLTGKFWLDNPDCRIGASGSSPSASRKEYANLLDYTNEKVRQYRLAIIEEVIDRYNDTIDGIEIDFSRNFFLFAPEKVQEGAPLITEMLGRIRQKLDAACPDRKLWVIVRVPAYLEGCDKLGFEVEEWMRQKLIDVIVPTQLMTTPFEMPLDEFTKLAGRYGCRVYAGLYERVGWEFPFYRSPWAYDRAPDRTVTPEMMRAAYANYWAMGADGMYLFNMKLRYDKESLGDPMNGYYQTVRDALAPECIRYADKVYAVTKAYYLDFENSYTYAKQIPFKIESEQEKSFTICVRDESLKISDLLFPRSVSLRLGFTDLKEEDRLDVKLNGRLLYSGPAGKYLQKTNSPKPINRLTPKAAGVFWQYPIESVDMLVYGTNTLSVIGTFDSAKETTVTDINIGFFFEK